VLPKYDWHFITVKPPLLRLRLPVPCFRFQYGVMSKYRAYSLTALENCQI